MRRCVLKFSAKKFLSAWLVAQGEPRPQLLFGDETNAFLVQNVTVQSAPMTARLNFSRHTPYDYSAESDSAKGQKIRRLPTADLTTNE
ncbi:hypothetical protein VTN31DRAFT_2999 [Thermomyces dupontii]|uniref:uncharacterized protein n=1 Tax=Talaromyces thermophilus TaxID=28565 RepID=UPI0037442852